MSEDFGRGMTILCAVTFSSSFETVLASATTLASHLAGRLCLVHVLPPIPPIPADPAYIFYGPKAYLEALRAQAEAKLRVIRERVPSALNAKTLVGQGPAAREIIRLAREEKTQLIVLAHPVRQGWWPFRMRSLAEELVLRAEQSILVVPVRTIGEDLPDEWEDNNEL